MVHKKSEYELQYLKLTNDIRAQIWRENVVFRESQKRMNSSDHYWRYQLVEDACDCEDDCREEDAIERYRLCLKKPEASRKPVYQNKAVQTPDGNETVHELLELRENAGDISLEQKTSPSMEKSNVSVPSIAKADVSELNTTVFNGSSLFNQQIIASNKEKTISKENHPPCIDNVKSRCIETPLKNDVHWSHFASSPTRNALKHYRSKSKPDPVFAAFGWNESNIDVSSHKTFNVRAPVDQVHNTALMASGKRLKNLEFLLAEQLRRRQQHQSELSIRPVNLSSLWMTEYQESFSRGQREPLFRSPFRRPVVWRHT